METSRKRLRMNNNQPSSMISTDKDLQTLLGQFDKEQENGGSDDTTIAEQTRSVVDHQQTISETLHTLEEGIMSIRSCLEKPKAKKVNMNEINRKVDLILEILNSWNTTASS